jgi:hypothetical protein
MLSSRAWTRPILRTTLPRTRAYATVPPATARRSATDVALIAGGGAILTGLLLWRSSKGQAEDMGAAAEGQHTSFTVPVIAQCVLPFIVLPQPSGEGKGGTGTPREDGTMVRRRQG